jgi:Kef-type K+ transport system membrane component KefB
MARELQLLLILALVILASKYAGHLSRRMNQPVVFGEILIGLILGPSLLNVLHWPIFPGSSAWLQETITLFAHVGVLLLMFIAGLETDLDQMRQVGKAALVSASAGVIAPLVLGTGSALLLGIPPLEALFIGVVLTATSVSISAQTLMELGQLKSREGMTILGAAVIDDVLGIIVLSFLLAFGAVHAPGVAATLPQSLTTAVAALFRAPAAAQFLQVPMTLVLMTAFFVGTILVSKLLPRLFAWAEGLHASHMIPALALSVVFVLSVGAEAIGQVAAITGAFMAGVLLARTAYRQQIVDSIHPFTYALFVPIFFISIGLGADLHLVGGGSWLLTGTIVVVAIVSKIAGCGLGARACGLSHTESLRVGVGMISRGEVGLIVAQIGLSSGIIAMPVYTAIIVMVLATTIVTPLLLRRCYPRTLEREAEVYESVATLVEEPI